MNALEKFERVGKAGILGIFFISLVLSAMFSYQIYFSLSHFHRPFPPQKLFEQIELGLSVVLILLPALRYFRRKGLAIKNPSLRPALKDEVSRADWLKAFRPTFFLLLFIQVASKLPLTLGIPWDTPFTSPLSLSAAVMSLTGFFLYYNRGGRHA